MVAQMILLALGVLLLVFGVCMWRTDGKRMVIAAFAIIAAAAGMMFWREGNAPLAYMSGALLVMALAAGLRTTNHAWKKPEVALTLAAAILIAASLFIPETSVQWYVMTAGSVLGVAALALTARLVVSEMSAGHGAGRR